MKARCGGHKHRAVPGLTRDLLDWLGEVPGQARDSAVRVLGLTPSLVFAVLAVLAVLLTGPVPTHAQSDFPAIDRAKEALGHAAKSLKGANSGRARLAALGKAVGAYEAALAAYREGLRNMATRESRIRRDMARDRAQLEQLIGALQSLSRAPRSALLAFPGGPVGAARGAGMMAEISPALNVRIEELRARLDALRQLRAGQQAARVDARAALATLQELRTQTAEAIRRKRARDLAPRGELIAQAEAAEAQARTIDDLAATLLGAALTDTGALIRFSEARGFIQPPVHGTLIAGFGDNDPWGRPGFGLTFSAPAYAQVSAPWDGTVRFAGRLIDYGQVVVLEPEEGTLIVMAGLARVDRLVGETVLSGERLGDLGGPIPDSDEFLLEASTDRDEIVEEKLYMELRRGGQAIDPAAWFDLTEKGSGG